MLVGITTMLAMQTNNPEFVVGEDEMNAFLGSAQKVARHYSVETTQKTLDWIAFIGVSGQVFGTRVVAVNMRRRQERAAPGQARPAAPGATNVHPIRADALDVSGIVFNDG